MKAQNKSTSRDRILRYASRAIEIGALQKLSELTDFLRAAAKAKPKVVVEIGTARGGTLYALCQVAADDAKIISIDLPGGPFGGGYTKADTKYFLSFKKPNQTIHFILKDSHKNTTVMEVTKLVGGPGKVDLLLIDGDHSYGGVSQDWTWYTPLVKQGGLVALHDIVFHKNMPDCQVDRLWLEVRDKHKSESFIDWNDHDWGGIGLIHFKERPVFKSEKARGILLDISPIPNKQPQFTGMANREHSNVDIIHDPEKFPWPFKDNSCHLVIAHNYLHHVKPWLFNALMDEIWRVLKPGGQAAFSMPYGNSPGFLADPLSCKAMNETTFSYFDPQFRNMYEYYKPKPWMIEKGTPQWSVVGNLEVAMRPRK